MNVRPALPQSQRPSNISNCWSLRREDKSWYHSSFLLYYTSTSIHTSKGQPRGSMPSLLETKLKIYYKQRIFPFFSYSKSLDFPCMTASSSSASKLWFEEIMLSLLCIISIKSRSRSLFLPHRPDLKCKNLYQRNNHHHICCLSSSKAHWLHVWAARYLSALPPLRPSPFSQCPPSFFFDYTSWKMNLWSLSRPRTKTIFRQSSCLQLSRVSYEIKGLNSRMHVAAAVPNKWQRL